MRQIINTILIIVFVTTVCNGQIISKNTQKIVDALAKTNEVQCAAIGYGGSPSGQYQTYKKLCETASNTELILLTNDSNETVRCYAFECLSGRPNVDLFTILLKHLTDDKPVTVFCGCTKIESLVGDYFIEVVTQKRMDNRQFKLSEKQHSILDSLLIFQKGIKLYAKYSLLREIKPDIKYHSRIRQIATKEKIAVAGLALARYKNSMDIEVIKKIFNDEENEYYAIYAAKEFPDSSFYPLLVKIFEREWNNKYYDYEKWRILYQALAKYPRQETFELFKRTTETKDDFRYQRLCTYLTIAITKYPHKLFEPLKDKIKLNQYYQDDVIDQMHYED